MKRSDLLVFTIFVVVALGAWAVWMHRWQAQVAKRGEMYALYANGGAGDRASVRRLAEYCSPEAIHLIEKLAQDRSAVADGRLEAISILGAKRPVDSKTLAPLLEIDQPFVVRHATAEAFEAHGCDDQCVSATVYGLHAIWKGDPAIEAAPSTKELEQKYGLHLDSDADRKMLAELRDKTEQDYWKLLKIDVCATQRALTKDYSSESAFVKHVQSKLGSC